MGKGYSFHLDQPPKKRLLNLCLDSREAVKYSLLVEHIVSLN